MEPGEPGKVTVERNELTSELQRGGCKVRVSDEIPCDLPVMAEPLEQAEMARAWDDTDMMGLRPNSPQEGECVGKR